MEKVYGSVRPLPKEKGTRRRRRSDRRNRAQAQAVVTTVPAGDEAASQYDAVLAEAASASVGESVSAYAEDVIIDVEILPDTGTLPFPEFSRSKPRPPRSPFPQHRSPSRFPPRLACAPGSATAATCSSSARST